MLHAVKHDKYLIVSQINIASLTQKRLESFEFRFPRCF
jgi:hypothetical protein